MIVAAVGHLETTELLIEKGADVNAQMKGGGTALWWAADRGRVENVRLLIEKGAISNSGGNE